VWKTSRSLFRKIKTARLMPHFCASIYSFDGTEL
jgi:hypothetical protein